ncbi:hypothetical protein GGS24DRAFT_330960 [Hypoxylon argillaceum]|nr:hypothetical protein GGS24DRAFT_330960 [Hypoxylon argillaceum]KAI1153957.1 hypothetical protein F4825DRAFT_449033 [Nemania diffusa]
MSAPMFRSLFARLSLTSPPLTRATTRSMSPTIAYITTSATNTPSSTSPPTPWRQSRSFHITAAQSKSVVPAKGSKKQKKKKKKKGKKGRDDGPDPRIVNLKTSMPRTVPSPLRFARNRALRHWTIHRAWLLFQRKERVRREHELEKMYQSMHNACEELRSTSGPGTREEGYLYRVAMEKHGMYGHNAVPIEYARPQTETPARQAWNHEWTRS